MRLSPSRNRYDSPAFCASSPLMNALSAYGCGAWRGALSSTYASAGGFAPYTLSLFVALYTYAMSSAGSVPIRSSPPPPRSGSAHSPRNMLSSSAAPAFLTCHSRKTTWSSSALSAEAQAVWRTSTPSGVVLPPISWCAAGFASLHTDHVVRDPRCAGSVPNALVGAPCGTAIAIHSAVPVVSACGRLEDVEVGAVRQERSRGHRARAELGGVLRERDPRLARDLRPEP